MNLYVMKEGERLGPISLEEVRNLKNRGEIKDTDLAWYEGLTEWITLAQVPGVERVVSNSFPPTIPLVTLPPSPAAGKGDQSLLMRRLLTGLVLSAVLFVILFFVFFILSLTVGGAISGGMASMQQHAQSYDDGYKIGQAVGQKFSREYSGIIMACSLIGALLASIAISFAAVCSKLLPWCRPRSD